MSNRLDKVDWDTDVARPSTPGRPRALVHGQKQAIDTDNDEGKMLEASGGMG